MTEGYACLYAREFPAQAMLRLRPHLQGLPCVVLEGDPPLQRVCSLNGAARKLGIASGMTRVEVDNFASARVLPRSILEEASAKAALLECAGTFSPRMENQSIDGEFVCVIDIAGTEKLLGAPDALAKSLLDYVRSLGIMASVAVSSNFYAAICMARGMSPLQNMAVIPAGAEGPALSPLRVNVLRLTDEQAQTFSSWGIQTLGLLAALPEKELIARMGQEGKRLRQLARGELPHLFLPVEPAFTLEERIELDSPVELLESLLFVVGVILEQLILRATNHVLALASVTVTLSLEGGAAHKRIVRPALPTNDRQLWIKLIHLDLEAHPPMAAILALALRAEPGRTGKLQFGLFSPQLPEPGRLDVTLARIRAIVGEECVGRAVLKDTHEPDEFRMEPFGVLPATSTEAVPQPCRSALRQLRPAENTAVTLREYEPKAFFFQGAQYTVERAYGPWTASGGWWNAEGWGMEQWDLVARAPNGVSLCCCLVRDLSRDRWMVTALYD